MHGTSRVTGGPNSRVETRFAVKPRSSHVKLQTLLDFLQSAYAKLTVSQIVKILQQGDILRGNRKERLGLIHMLP